MAKITLKRLLKKELSQHLQLLSQLVDAPIAIFDLDGTQLFGHSSPVSNASSAPERFPITLEGEAMGWVEGMAAEAQPVALLLSIQVAQVIERRSLANEALEKYREINLLYSIAEKLTSCRDVESVVQLALAEAHRLIPGTSAVLFLLDLPTQALTVRAVLGETLMEPVLKLGEGITGHVAASKKPEIVNDVLNDERFQSPESGIRSLLCAPMQAQEKVIGVIGIYNAELRSYLAEDLKLLTAIALQAAPALESAIFLQQEMEAARKREAELQEKLKELRIEIDQAKRERQVAEITESDFFQSLKKKAETMRKRAKSPPEDLPPS